MSSHEPVFEEPVDITKELKESCKLALVPGELLHGSWFSLQYAIFAIEIMDPKLDSRCQNLRRVPTLREAITRNILQVSTFEDKRVLLGIMDELLCSFVNWINGDLLMQTIFSSMYMHCTQLVEDDHLVLFCESLRKIVLFLREIIISASVYEEEDFYSNLCGMTLEGPDKRFDNFNERAEKFNATYRSESGSIESELLLDKLKEVCDELSENNQDWHYNLSIRFRYIRDLLNISNNMYKIRHDKKIETMMTNLYLEDEHQKNSVSLLQIIEECNTSTSDLIGSTHELIVTYNAGIEAKQGKEDPQNFEYGIPGFEPRLNASKQPASIPRSVKIIPRHDGFIYLTEQAQRLRNVVILFYNFLKNTKPEDKLSKPTFWIIMQKLSQIEGRQMKSIINDAEKSPRLQIAGGCLLSRSFCRLISRLILDENPKIKTNQTVEGLLRFWSKMDPLVDEMYFDQVLEKQFVPDILSHCDQLLNNMININCYNTSRQYTAIKNLFRDYMVNSSYWYHLENTLASVYDKEVILKDQRPHFGFIMTYYFYHLVWNFLVQGFTLELYSCSEMPSIYTFLLSHLRNLEKFIEGYLMDLKSNYAYLKFSKANLDKAEKKFKNVVSRFSTELIYIKGISFMVGGSLMTHLAILKDSHLDMNAEPLKKSQESKLVSDKLKLNLPKNNHEEIFARRFGTLLSNPLLFPKEYCGREKACNYLLKSNDETMNTKTSKELYAQAAKLFNGAKETFGLYKAQGMDNDKAVEEETMLKIFPHPTQSDNIDDMVIVAKRNTVICNVLASCPDKRPTQTLTKPATPHFPYKNSPVTLDYSQLISKSMPVVVLNNPPKKT